MRARLAGRRLWMIVGATLVVLLAILALVFVDGGSDALAELRIHAGSVDVKKAGMSFATGAEGQELAAGDGVRTAGSGQAQVDFFDESLTRMDQDTHVELRQLRDGPESDRISMRLENGRIWNRVPSLGTSDTFEVHFVQATASVLGTTFLLDCRGGTPCILLVVRDDVTLRAPNDEEQLGPGDCAVYTEAGQIEPCDAADLRRVKDDWYRQNLAADEVLDRTVIATPSVTPGPTTRQRPRRSGAPPVTSPSPSVSPSPSTAPSATDAPPDADGDGVPDASDDCPGTPDGAGVDSNGCADSQLDSDSDGVPDSDDECPNTPANQQPNQNGCSDQDLDSDDDDDGVPDSQDNCEGTPPGTTVDSEGCPV